MGLLEGKVVLISGAGRGQGRAHAVLSAQEGADIVAFDINTPIATVPYDVATDEDLAETARQVEALDRRIVAVTADARSQQQVDDVVARGIAEFGKIDCAIVNHGIFSTSPYWLLSDDQWNDMIDVNLTAVWRVGKAVTPHMIERQSGSIVLTSSLNGVTAAPIFAHYAAAKHGVIGLMKSMAQEAGRYGIRVNALMPGTTKTPMVNHQGAWNMMTGTDHGTMEQSTEVAYHVAALKGTTWMDPMEQAKAALFLNSDLADRVTGISLPVDGGSLVLNGYNHSPVK